MLVCSGGGGTTALRHFAAGARTAPYRTVSASVQAAQERKGVEIHRGGAIAGGPLEHDAHHCVAEQLQPPLRQGWPESARGASSGCNQLADTTKKTAGY
jgi:hypothetical protein